MGKDKEKKPRKPQEIKLAIQIKKKVGYSTEPHTCENCKLNTTDIPELFEGADLGCTKFKELVVFGVDKDGSCGAWVRRPKPRVASKSEEHNSEGSSTPPPTPPPTPPKKKPSSGKKK